MSISVRIIVLFLSIGVIACSQTNQEGIKLTGSLEEYQAGANTYIEYVSESGVEPLDTLVIATDGTFEHYFVVPDAGFYRINFDERQIISVILTGEEEVVEINAQGNDPRGFVEVSGSTDTEYKNQMDELMTTYRAGMQQLKQEQMQARQNNDGTLYLETQNQMVALATETQDKLKILIREASPSLAAFYGLQMINPEENVTFMDSVSVELAEKYPENAHVNNLISQLSTKKRLAIGEQAPEISLQNPDGDIITLSSLKGKYVLIDFWAAWCRPCRAENPNVVKVYNEYSDKNFEILGVSLDRTREKWLGAIEQDGLPWLHVSDLKFWRSQAAQDYQVGAIPATFLIDPSGKIIAKNLRGASLEAKLKEIFG